MLKISCARTFGLSSGISSQFTLKMCTAAKNCNKNLLKIKVIDVDKVKKPVTYCSACYDKQHVCTYLQPFSH